VLPIVGSGLPDDDFAAFAPFGDLEGDDPMTVAARSLAGRYATGPGPTAGGSTSGAYGPTASRGSTPCWPR